jgi:phage terminase large subunit-like protein
MGKRGPKTGAAKAAENTAKPSWRGKPPWEKRGLSRAGRVVAFIECLPITSGMHSGQKMQLRPWQREIIEAVYRVGGDGRRVVRTALLTLPRKNGKSQLAAALALCHLIGPEAESRGQVFSAASDRDQAAIIFRELEAIILAVPEFAARCNIKSFSKTIEDCGTGSVYQALSSDARKAHGLSPSFFIFDELAQSPNRHLFDNLTTGTGARAEPMAFIIGTQSSDPNHVMSELVDYSQKLQEGTLPPDPTFHGVVYAAADDDDPWSTETWYKANPALNDFRSLAEMQAFAEQARRIPAKEAAFKALYLNMRVDAEHRFVSSTDWDACGAPVDLEALRGRPCWAGLDLSSTSDLTALVLFFPEDGGAVVPFFWIPGESIGERSDSDRVPYREWVKADLIEATPGRAIDRLSVVRRVAQVTAAFDLRGLAYDRWRAEDLLKMLSDEGLDFPVTPWGQGFASMAPAVDTFEAMVLNGQFRHGGHPVLTWNLSNAIVETDPAGGRKISKSRSKERVDGVVALVMAVGLHAKQPKAPVFEFSGSLFLEY